MGRKRKKQERENKMHQKQEVERNSRMKDLSREEGKTSQDRGGIYETSYTEIGKVYLKNSTKSFLFKINI